MSRTISESTGKPYGIKRVCAVWNQARSTFYEQKKRVLTMVPGYIPAKRGPKTFVSDEKLLDVIIQDLANSPFTGEGHRKVWARLRLINGFCIGKTRVLRIMRENHLLSPYRVRQGKPNVHDGIISTDTPNEMWGTDGTKVFTLADGWVWVFSAVDHWNAECMGWHVVKRGDRYAALEPVSQGLSKFYGSVNRDIARGLSLRMDHGSQYLSDHFINQLRFWGIKPSFAFVEQPQTNGVAERFNKTLKEQAIYGRIFQNVDDVRAAVGRFVDLYNNQWRVEKNGFLSPVETRLAWLNDRTPMAA
jgi:transposase InsO family protein